MATKKSWKDLLQEIKTYLNKGRKNLFHAVKKSVELYENREFREEYELFSNTAVENWFTDNLFKDYGLDFLDLKLIYKTYPSEKDWKERPLSELYETSLEDAAVEPVKETRKTVKYKKEFLEVKAALDGANDEIKVLRSTISGRDLEIFNLKTKVEELLQEIGDLKMANAHLEGRLSSVKEPVFSR